MVLKIHRGDSPAAAQVTTATPSNVEIGDTFILTINNKPIQYIALKNTVADVTAGLKAAIDAASDISEWAEITPFDIGDKLTLTAVTPGRPFEVTGTTKNTLAGLITIAETVIGSPPKNEVQQLKLLGTSTGGTFTITWDPSGGDETTTAIAYNATAAAVQASLEALTTPTVGDFSVTGPAGGPWLVSFTGTYAATDVNLMAINGGLLTGAGAVDIAATQEGSALSDTIIQIGFPDTGGQGAGTFTLSVFGQSTSAVASNATAAALETALEALDSVGTGNVKVYRGVASPDGPVNVKFILHFKAALAETNVVVGLNSAGIINPLLPIILVYIHGGSTTIDEVQILDLGDPTSGTFTISFGGQTTPQMDHDDSAFDVTGVLENLATIGAGNIQLSAGTSTLQYWLVRFKGAKSNTDQAALQLNSAGLVNATSPGVTTIKDGGGNTPEIQSITIVATGGTFTLSFDGQGPTAAIAFGATAATVETQLELLSNITNVTVSGTGTALDPYLVTFVDPSGNVALMTGDAASLTGGAGIVTVEQAFAAAVNEQQTVTIDAGVTGGTFTLKFNNVETAAIAYNASAASVDTDLTALSSIDSISVSGSAGGPWTVTFDSVLLAATDVNLLVADGALLVGGSGTQTFALSETVRSAGPEHLDDPINWTGNRVPDSSDDIVFSSGKPARYGINWLTDFTVDTGTNELILTSRADFVDDQIIRVISDDTLPAGLVTATDYYIINLNRDTNRLQVSLTSGGAAVVITTGGSGTHTAAVEVNSFEQRNSSDEDIGLPRYNADGDYFEYRPLDFAFGLLGDKEVRIGTLSGIGSALININNGPYQAAWLIFSSGQGDDGPAVRLQGSHVSNTLVMLDGSVAIATRPGETSKLGASGTVLKMRGGELELGNGVAITGDVEHAGEFIPNDSTISGKIKRTD